MVSSNTLSEGRFFPNLDLGTLVSEGKEFLKLSAVRAAQGVAAIHAIPTAVRRFREYDTLPLNEIDHSGRNYFATCLAGIWGPAAVAYAYALSAAMVNPEILVVPLATSVLSGIYEASLWDRNRERTPVDTLLVI